MWENLTLLGKVVAIGFAIRIICWTYNKITK